MSESFARYISGNNSISCDISCWPNDGEQPDDKVKISVHKAKLSGDGAAARSAQFPVRNVFIKV